MNQIVKWRLHVLHEIVNLNLKFEIYWNKLYRTI